MRYEKSQREFIKLIKSFRYVHSYHKVFSDFCTLAAIELQQVFAKSKRLEEEYMAIGRDYEKEDVQIFPKLFNLLIEGLSSRFGDFLGECYMQLEISNKNQGQFFTPYNISVLMSSLAGLPSREAHSILEPTVGSGGMLIAYAEVLKKANINYHDVMQVQAIDTDRMCFFMCYIHLSLLGIQAEVIWGNSLTLEVYDKWHTPMKIIKENSMSIYKIEKEEKTEECEPLTLLKCG